MTIPKDKHLNIFKRYKNKNNQGTEIENNLTRALAICLQNDPLFFKEFVSQIVPNSTFEYFGEEAFAEIGIQERVVNFKDDTNIEKVYGVTLTTKKIPTIDFEKAVATGNDNQIVDLYIKINDLLIVVEVKRSDEHCAKQLKSQLFYIADKVQPYQSLTWDNVMTMVRSTQNVHSLLNNSSVFLDDFRALIGSEYPHWLPTIPFAQIIWKPNSEETYSRLNKRLSAISSEMKNYELETIGNRSFFTFHEPWASEVIPEFNKQEQKLAVYIWPGNSKQQGYSIFHKDIDQSWQNKKSLQIGDFGSFPLKVIPQVKITNSRSRFEAELNFSNPKNDLIKTLHTNENFPKSGRWKRENWHKLEALFDEHIQAHYDWRSKCNWIDKFLNSNRSVINICLGFAVGVEIPFKLIQELDKVDKDKNKVAKLLEETCRSFEGLLD